jgi:hypothetical protein
MGEQLDDDGRAEIAFRLRTLRSDTADPLLPSSDERVNKWTRILAEILTAGGADLSPTDATELERHVYERLLQS